MLILIVSSGPSVQGELRTKDFFCSSEVPHTNLCCSPLFISSWTLPSSKKLQCEAPLQTRSSRVSELTLSPQKKKKKKLFSFSECWISSSRRVYFQPICRLYNLDFVFLVGAQSELRLQRVFCLPRNRHSSRPLLRKSACKHQQKLAWSCSSSLHCRDRVCPSPGQLQIGSFFRGADVSADVPLFHQLCACLSALP